MRSPFDVLSRRRSQPDSEERDRLCLICDKIDFRQILQLKVAGWSQTLGFSDIKSHRKSCNFCSLLFESVQTVCVSKGGHHVNQKITHIRISSYARHQLLVNAIGVYRLPLDLKGRVGEAYLQENFEEEFFLQAWFPNLMVKDGNPAQLIDENGIDFEEVKSWLFTCHHRHNVDCDPATKYGFVQRPKRLLVLDVQELCVADLPENVHYAALSYVWGGVQLLGLTKDNFGELRKPQGLNKYADLIPATIGDAIRITNEIAIRYLWVDSMCIQQDAPAETAYQVENMHNIFGSAHVTLIAASGESANAGIPGTTFTPRQVLYGLKSVEVEPGKPVARRIGPGLELGLVALNNYRNRWDITDEDSLPKYGDVTKTKWNHRAWTFQEWLLSSRALVFTDDQVFWHCNKAVWCEKLLGRRLDILGHAIDSRYSRIGNLTSNPHFQGSWKRHDASIEVKRDGRTLVVSSEAFLLYKAIVSSYTPREIGRIDDRLAAFDGIGKVIEQCFGSKLLYGLPESLLDVAILWQAKTTLVNVHRTGFPSWSWAGWEGGVCYPDQYGIEHNEPRELYENETAEERIQPVVRWYKADDAGGFVPINGKGFGIRETLRDSGDLPSDWKGVLAPSESRNIDIEVSSSSPHILRCYTMRATFVASRSNLSYNTEKKNFKPHPRFFRC